MLRVSNQTVVVVVEFIVFSFLLWWDVRRAQNTSENPYSKKIHRRVFSPLLSSAQKASESQCTSPLPEIAACKRDRMEAKARKINSSNELIQTEWPGSCFKPKLNNTRIKTANEKSEDVRLTGRYVYALCSSLFLLITAMKRN